MAVWEYKPQGNLMPPALGGGSVRKVRKGVYADKTYDYAWDGLHDGGELEVYAKSDKTRVGAVDPATKTWHDKKAAKPGRRIQVFAVGVRVDGAVAFGPLTVAMDRPPSMEVAALWPFANSAQISARIEEAGILVPRGLRWRYIVGDDLPREPVEQLLAQSIEELRVRFGVR